MFAVTKHQDVQLKNLKISFHNYQHDIKKETQRTVVFAHLISGFIFFSLKKTYY